MNIPNTIALKNISALLQDRKTVHAIYSGIMISLQISFGKLPLADPEEMKILLSSFPDMLYLLTWLARHEQELLDQEISGGQLQVNEISVNPYA